ncbi:hypothetical protein C8F01DRAFT_1259251 [Mycena amicta]|nr:hypothetical protein C8F01DRAFT_1259251 [Mycena amicta]
MRPKTQSRGHGPAALGSGYPAKHRKYDRRDLVLAKIDLLPFLPGMTLTVWDAFQIMDANDVPSRIHKMRPEQNQDSTYAVRLFPKGDYYWVAESELEPLSCEQISAFIAGTPDPAMDRRLYGVGKRRMVKAYVAASEPDEWEVQLAAATTKLQPAATNGIEQDRAGVGFAGSGSSSQLHSGHHMDSDANNSEDERTVASMLRAAPAEVDALTEKQKLELAKDPEAVRAMIRLNDVLAQIETYENMTVDYLVFSKILKIIATDDELPDDMKRSRPSKSVSAPSSKKEEIFYPVRFFPKGDYAWASLDRISRLSPAHVAAFLEDRLSKDTNEHLYGVGKNRVIQGYRAAACPEEWLENLATKKDAKEKKVKTKEGDARQGEGENWRDEEAAAMDNTGAPSDKEDNVKAKMTSRKSLKATEDLDGKHLQLHVESMTRGSPKMRKTQAQSNQETKGRAFSAVQGRQANKATTAKNTQFARSDPTVAPTVSEKVAPLGPDTPAIGRESRPSGKKNRAKRRAGQKAEEEETAPDPESEEDSGRAATTISQTDKQPGSSVERDVTTDVEMHADEEEEHGPCEKRAGARNTDAKRREDEAELPKVRLRTTKASRSASNGNQPSTATREDARQPFFTFPHPADRDPSPPTSEANRKLTASKTTQGKNVARKNKGSPYAQIVFPKNRTGLSNRKSELKVEHPLAGRGGGGAGSGQGEIGDKDMSEAKLKEIYAWQEGVKRNLKHRASGDLESVSSKTKRRKEDAGTYSISEKRYEELDENEDATKLAQWRYDIQVAIFPHDNRRPLYSKLMGRAGETFALLDSFEGMTIEYIAYSKLLKLMKRISEAEPERLPRDTEFHFRQRAAAFVEKWEAMLDGLTLED